MDPQIEYATTTDGVSIANFSLGSGAPLLIAATPPWSHVQQEMSLFPPVGALLRSLAEQAQIVRYDSRGTGLSDRLRIPPNVAQVRRDHVRPGMNVAHDALAGRNRARQLMLDGMSRFVLRNRRIHLRAAPLIPVRRIPPECTGFRSFA